MRAMKVRSGLFVAGMSLVCALQAHAVQTRGPSTVEERAKVVSLTRSLERDPAGADTPAIRQWLREWIIEVPDIRVYTCDELLGPVLADRYRYSREVSSQAMFSAAAFAIERQDKARDEIAQYNAGVEGALRVYETLLKSNPDARSAFLDGLLVKRDRGELPDHIAKLANEKCKRANTDLIASVVGAGVGLVLGLLVARWSPGGQTRRLTNVEGFTAASGTMTATVYRRIVFFCVAYFLIVVSALHVLEPEFDPRYRFISEYVWGAYGWLMTTTFFVLGLAAFTVAAGLRSVHQSSWSARLGFGVLAVGALFVCLAGVFKDFLAHLAASAVAIPSIILSALLLSWSFRQAAEWRPIHRVSLLIAVGMLVAFVSVITTHFAMPGLLQRAVILLFLLWFSIVAHQLVRAAENDAMRK